MLLSILSNVDSGRAKDEDNVRSSILKIWELGKIDKRTGVPALLRTAKVQPAGKPHPVCPILPVFLARIHPTGIGLHTRVNLVPLFSFGWSC